jgi:hypothetical protein
MNRNWLFLRPFDESADVPFEKLGLPAVVLSLILTAAQPISIIISVFKLSKGDDAGSFQWMALGFAISVIIAAYQAMLRRRGHAANQLILSAILLGLLCL